MNTNIENIRLKNGEEYPVSPAYFDGITVPFNIELGDPSIDLMTVSMGGEVQMAAWKISSTLPSAEDFEKIQAFHLHIVGGSTLYDMDCHVTPGNVYDFDTAMKKFEPDMTVLDLSSVPSTVAVMNVIGAWGMGAVLLSPQKGTFYDTTRMIEINIPSEGLYAVVQNARMFGNVSVSGELGFGEYTFPENYYRSMPYEEISADWTADLDPMYHSTEPSKYNLHLYPTQKAALQRALTSAKPLRICTNPGSLILDTCGFAGFDEAVWAGNMKPTGRSIHIPGLHVKFGVPDDLVVTGTITSSDVTVDTAIFGAKTSYIAEPFIFTYDGQEWILNGHDAVTLPDYGITLSADPAENDVIEFTLGGDFVEIGWTKVMDIPAETQA